jgi:hypothetical protein
MLDKDWPSRTAEISKWQKLEQGLVDLSVILQTGRLQSHEVWTRLNAALQGVSDYLLHPVADACDRARTGLDNLRDALDNGRKL